MNITTFLLNKKHNHLPYMATNNKYRTLVSNYMANIQTEYYNLFNERHIMIIFERLYYIVRIYACKKYIC